MLDNLSDGVSDGYGAFMKVALFEETEAATLGTGTGTGNPHPYQCSLKPQ